MPFGKLCTARAKSTGRQCGQAAVRGYSVCRVHGAGTRKRVLEGIRKSPRLAPIKTGLRVCPRTAEERRILDPEYARQVQKSEQNPALMDIAEVAKRLYAVLRMGDRYRLTLEERVRFLCQMTFALCRMEEVRLKTHLRLRAELKVFLDGVAEAFREFVPPERLEEALAWLRSFFDRLEEEIRSKAA